MREISIYEDSRSIPLPIIPNDQRLQLASGLYDARAHYLLNNGPTHEFGELSETQPTIRNIGWTLGNDCPFRCIHCYSFVARERGKDMDKQTVDRIVDQLAINSIRTVNLGGNEPLFTNGPDPRDTMLPYIIESLVNKGIATGITTSGISVLYLYDHHKRVFNLLNDVDVSFDSPIEKEHNANRGADLYWQAIKLMSILQAEGKPHTAIMAGMNWNFTLPKIEALVQLAKKYDAHIRINPVKPVEPRHMLITLPPEQYYEGFARLMELCEPVDLGEPPIAAVTSSEEAKRCPCGRTSFRIHSITPDGGIYVSPCVYLHDYKSDLDLREHDLADIINSPQFRVFRQRNAHPELVEGCDGCTMIDKCGGGCTARSYLYRAHTSGEKTLLAQDPYCPVKIEHDQSFPQNPKLQDQQLLVHADYLCTWIGKPKRN
ncbi:radical SAM protein [Candidatus Daviesbacteria bacterium]|nr:radical SAM protein [Candidatus Daviesbacteria bacterium]